MGQDESREAMEWEPSEALSMEALAQQIKDGKIKKIVVMVLNSS